MMMPDSLLFFYNLIYGYRDVGLYLHELTYLHYVVLVQVVQIQSHLCSGLVLPLKRDVIFTLQHFSILDLKQYHILLP